MTSTLIEKHGKYSIHSMSVNSKGHLAQFEVREKNRVISSGYHILREAQGRVSRLIKADEKAAVPVKPVVKKNFKIVKKEVA